MSSSKSAAGMVCGFPVLLGVLFLVATCIKVLLIPTYRSTDFEVHRNWLAISHSLPVSQWYYESTSPWTLDYPPFFAWFEWVLSQPAALLDPVIVNVSALNYASHTCILFQRFTVITSDLTLLYALIQYYKYQTSRSHDHDHSLATMRSVAVSVLVLLNYGLLIVDHVHFQYNGFLMGILLLSTVRIMQGRYLEGGFWFAVLLNLKHIFLYMSPAFFTYLLKHYCCQGNSNSKSKLPSKSNGFLLGNFIKLGCVVILVFLLSLGPFLYLGQVGQVLSRLFPFKRGLCHAYWAPNVWALYSLGDMLVATIGRRLVQGGVFTGTCEAERCGSMTSGLVGEMNFKLLPNISPWMTILLTALSMLPGVIKVWLKRNRSPCDFPELLVLCAFSSFLFGWHVHEKAVLLITIPMSLLAVEDDGYTGVFLLVSMTGHVSLFPLLHQSAETLVKLSLFVSCTCMSFMLFTGSLRRLLPSKGSPSTTTAPPDKDKAFSHESWPLFSWSQTACVLLLLVVQVYCTCMHGLIENLRRYEFLPLLLTSVTCALVMVLSWMQFLQVFISH